MIIFDLACVGEHRFEGWFHSAEDFAQQLARDLVVCPHCASVDVRRLPSAVHLATARPEVSSAAVPADGGAQPRGAVVPSAVDTDLARTLDAMLAACEDVGGQFAEEARRIHYAESPARPIRGEASHDDYEALREEGIDVYRLPRLPKKVLS